MKLISVVVSLALPVAAPAVVVEAQTACSFLPVAEPIVYELHLNAIAPGVELPMEFRGLSATVSRRTTKQGETPRVLVTRYSAGAPSLTYDETMQKVIVPSNACASVIGSAAGGTARTCSSKSQTFVFAQSHRRPRHQSHQQQSSLPPSSTSTTPEAVSFGGSSV